MTKRDDEVISTEVQSTPAVLSLLHASEIDMQIATAHKFPRSIAQFRRDVFDMVGISEAVAAECTYALPRDGKMVEGPSARFAEILASAWGNSRAGARVVDEGPNFITAQGVFHDLQKNVAITFEVQRRITGKRGQRYSDDMIAVTGNAASSIALRNAILKGIPKAFWQEMWDTARRVALGDAKTLPSRRAEAFAAAQKFGVLPEQIVTKLKVKGEADIGLEHLALLRSILTAIREGDTTAEQAFAPDDEDRAQVPTPQRASGAGGSNNATTAAKPTTGTGGQGGTGFSGGTAPAAAQSAPSTPPAPAPTATPAAPEAGAGGAVDTAFVAAMDRVEREPLTPPPPHDQAANGEPATEGEIANIKRRAAAARTDLDALCEVMGLKHLIGNIGAMTKDDFRVLKAKLS